MTQGSALSRSRGSPSAVIVDDHPLLRAGIAASLTNAGIHVAGEAPDGRAAIEVVRQQRPDVIVLDMLLPQLNGIDVMKTLLAEMPGLRFVAFSTREDPWFVQEVMAAGAAGYVFKRSPENELIYAVQQVAAGKTYVDRALASDYPPRSGRRSQRGLGGGALSQREAEVLRLVALGMAGKEAARQLKLSPRTLETYKARAMQKLQLRTRADLMRFAEHSGWFRETEELSNHG